MAALDSVIIDVGRQRVRKEGERYVKCTISKLGSSYDILALHFLYVYPNVFA
jgi:hypothetical protein